MFKELFLVDTIKLSKTKQKNYSIYSVLKIVISLEAMGKNNVRFMAIFGLDSSGNFAPRESNIKNKNGQIILLPF